jgi:hypothetical protein
MEDVTAERAILHFPVLLWVLHRSWELGPRGTGPAYVVLGSTHVLMPK